MLLAGKIDDLDSYHVINGSFLGQRGLIIEVCPNVASDTFHINNIFVDFMCLPIVQSFLDKIGSIWNETRAF